MHYFNHPEAISFHLHGLALVAVYCAVVEVDTGQAAIQLCETTKPDLAQYLASINPQKGCRSPS